MLQAKKLRQLANRGQAAAGSEFEFVTDYTKVEDYQIGEVIWAGNYKNVVAVSHVQSGCELVMKVYSKK